MLLTRMVKHVRKMYPEASVQELIDKDFVVALSDSGEVAVVLDRRPEKVPSEAFDCMRRAEIEIEDAKKQRNQPIGPEDPKKRRIMSGLISQAATAAESAPTVTSSSVLSTSTSANLVRPSSSSLSLSSFASSSLPAGDSAAASSSNDVLSPRFRTSLDAAASICDLHTSSTSPQNFTASRFQAQKVAASSLSQPQQRSVDGSFVAVAVAPVAQQQSQSQSQFSHLEQQQQQLFQQQLFQQQQFQRQLQQLQQFQQLLQSQGSAQQLPFFNMPFPGVRQLPQAPSTPSVPSTFRFDSGPSVAVSQPSISSSSFVPTSTGGYSFSTSNVNVTPGVSVRNGRTSVPSSSSSSSNTQIWVNGVRLQPSDSAEAKLDALIADDSHSIMVNGVRYAVPKKSSE
jgi:hypothetical protein